MAIGTPARLLATSVVASPAQIRAVLTAAPTDGSLVIVTVGFASNSGAITNVFDSHGNVYTQLYDSGNHSTTLRILTWICASQHGLQNGDAIFIDVGIAANAAITVDEITGLGTTRIPDVTIVDAFSASNVSSYSAGPTSTTTYANELIWEVIATNQSTGFTQTITPGTGWTQHGSRTGSSTASISLFTQYKIQSATAAHTGDGTINTTASHYQAAVFTFPDPQSPSNQRSASALSVSVAAQSSQRAASFVGVEVAGVITAPPPVTTHRRPAVIVA